MAVPSAVNDSLLFTGGNESDSIPISNCTADPYISGWGYRYFVANFTIAAVGAVGNIASLWSLFRCRKTNIAAKIQLGTFFGVQLIVCLLTLPGFSYVKKLALLCQAGDLPMGLKLLFLFTHTLFLPIERINFTAMAIMRLIAVRWPHHYKKFAQVKVVVVLEIILFLYVLSPWLVSFAIELHNMYPIEDQMTVTFSLGKGPTIRNIYLVHGINHLFPTFASLLAYSLMMYTMIRQKQTMGIRNDKNTTTMDHVAYTIRLVILVNLLLDVPHTLAHLMRVSQVPSLIIHSIFYMHLALDPFIFVGMNAHYRKALFASIRSCFSWERSHNVQWHQGLDEPAQRMSFLNASNSSQTRSGGTELTNDSGISNA
ncbi:uncharacterized protein [Palaemon carinicauda]|uniref:uncharacterized protein n=1 Tax=Palaemon carinicauda TaxID=392227 RepID=UPI0035B5ADA3